MILFSYKLSELTKNYGMGGIKWRQKFYIITKEYTINELNIQKFTLIAFTNYIF